MSVDLFGPVPAAAPAPFKDIRNQCESVAEEKARLCMELNRLLQTPPQIARDGIHPACAPVARGAQGRARHPEVERQFAPAVADRPQHHEVV